MKEKRNLRQHFSNRNNYDSPVFKEQKNPENICGYVCTDVCLFLFLTEEAYSHGGLQTRELGQTPLC